MRSRTPTSGSASSGRQPSATKGLTAFAWGYWNWGNATAELAELTAAVEKARGFAPPIFVDVRFRRTVRAEGFRGDAFAKHVPGRYRWIQGLGNANIGSGESGITIVDPAKAGELLTEVEAAARSRRRVIFFCSCQSPERAHDCHRVEVTKLLKAEAKRRGVALEVDEWPGSPPVEFELVVQLKTVTAARAVEFGDATSSPTIPLPQDVDVTMLASLGHMSLALLHAGDETHAVVTGPIVRRNGLWRLPVYGHGPMDELAWLRKFGAQGRKDLRLPAVPLAKVKRAGQGTEPAKRRR